MRDTRDPGQAIRLYEMVVCIFLPGHRMPDLTLRSEALKNLLDGFLGSLFRGINPKPDARHRCALAEEGGVPPIVSPLSSIPAYCYGTIDVVSETPISEATGDLRNLPGSILHTERELKVPLIVVSIPVGSNRLEQQEPGRRCIAHLIDATVDNRDANEEGWGCCPLLLQGLRVLPPGRIL